MYNIEIKPASKSTYFTPAEATNYYGKYARTGVTIHWWGDGSGASNHDNIVNYFLRRTDGSVNYVLSDNKITQMVDPNNVAWTSQSGNATTISIEHQPTLGTEGYKKSGWLIWQLEKRYGRRLDLYPHKYWWATQCPGTISLDRIRQEADKWARGEYNAPAPTPPPATTTFNFVAYTEGVRKFVINKNTNLWNFNATTWGAVKPVQPHNAGEEVDIKGYVVNTAIKATYLLTPYSFDRRITNGFNQVDLNLKVQPAPPPIVEPEPPVASLPDYVTNLRDIDDTKFWFATGQKLIDIKTGKPAVNADGKETIFAKDAEFVSSALTVASGVEYRITDYSYKKGIFNGVPIGSLTLTAPGIPDVPPVPDVPPTAPTTEERLTMLEAAVKAITEFLKKLFNFGG